jgi:organic radical activating enzyme
MDRVHLDKIEFYITNVCNLTCANCNRFNNHNFKGFQRWSDVEPLMEEWAKYIDFTCGVILGGEPLLNSSIVEWVEGINRIWGNGVQILSNGTRLHLVKDLYRLMSAETDTNIRGSNWLGISWHNSNTIDAMFEEIHAFLQGNVISKEGRDQTRTGADWEFIDDNGVQISVWMQNKFEYASMRTGENGKLTLWNHEGFEERIHAECGMAQHKCYHFSNGKFFKCAPLDLWPQFDQQIGLDITDADRELIASYQPLTIERARNGETKQFFEEIDSVIPQCKFCPKGWEQRREIIYSIEKGNSA